MKQIDISAAIEEFKKEHGSIEPFDLSRSYGFKNWAIGTQGDNVVLVQEILFETGSFYEFSLITIWNWKYYG